MKVLISERLSEHKYKTPEGYLICTDAILARTGKQRYTKDELFGNGDSEEVDVDRPYEQVMNEKTISSFENKPVTFDHPDEDVNVGNYKEYAVGYVRDVRQGKVDGQDVILGNLVITDQDAIDAIENGEHTDLSCGYDCDIKDDGHGSYYQNNIRGNHVALCREGRAGNARIVDSKLNDAAIGGHYKNSRGENFFICSYGSGFSIFKADGEYLDGSRHLSLDGVKQRILSYNLTKVKDSVGASKVKDDNLLGKRVRIHKRYSNLDGTIGTIFSYEGTNYDDEVEVKRNGHIYKVNYEDIEFLDSKANDADKYSYRLAKTKNDYDEYVIKAYKNGKYYEDASYYTDDWQDALDTLKMMAKREGLNFRQEGSRYVADSVNDVFNNGKLKDFRIEDLIRLVKERKEAVNSIRLDDKGNIYYIVVDGSLDTDLNTGKNASLDVVCEDKESHHQKRCIMLSRASSWKEIIATFNRWKDTIRDSIEDSNIVDCDIDDAWSGTRNGIIYSYHNGYYYITHENGKVERLPESKFDKIEDLYEYVDKIKDSSNLSTSKALKLTKIVSMLHKK